LYSRLLKKFCSFGWFLILASLFRQHAAPLRPQGPPSSYPTGLQPGANDSNGRNINRRISRTDLDFEQALRAEGTVVLREGIDVNSLGMESPSVNRSYSSSYSTPSTPVNRSISRVPLQPPTPVIVPPSPSTVSALSSPVMPNSVNWGGGGGSSSTGSGFVSKNATASPTIPSQDFPADSAEEAERQTNRRSMYRAPGTSSSPDLATLLRKAKERGGTGAPTVGALGRKDKRREEPPPPLPDHPNVLRHAPVSYNAGESSRNVALSSPNKLRDGTVKVCLSRQ